ncbi:hypothetical protein GRI89_07845 [Altererythrobacter salegens]|uniref:DUF8021 domain-containing protein n=1 Tax=Croceibacterium salegens TaxID=1737568 RepID=A0A6I4SYV6_9SPHN|nr:hypothetical protein [Croceibacterium salegens]MXO59452.1 hypothetical protein [Croceibacterium salegens]
MKRSFHAALACLALGLAGPAAADEPPGGVPLPQQNCQRECLEGTMNKYLQAMVDQKVNDGLFARDVRFTENGVQLPLGNEGLWATATGLGNYRFYVPDVETQQVTFMGTMMEEGRARSTGPASPPDPVGIDVRLKIDDEGKISEVEQIVARPDRPLGPAPATPASGFGATGANVEKMGSPHPIFLETVPENERMSRADLIAVANQYFEAMQRNDGKGYYPFTDDCLRHENGMISAGPPGTVGMTGNPVMTCKGQFETSLLGVVTGIRDRRFVAVDRERGLVFAFGAFDHRSINWTWEIGEIFKIEKNQIRRIEAIFIRGPYGVCSGWGTYEQCRSEEIQDVR